MQKTLAASAAVLFLILIPKPLAGEARPATYDLARDYSTNANPTGVWSYGWKSTLDGNFNLNPYNGFSREPAGGLLDHWQKAPISPPAIWHNAGDTTVINNQGQGVFPPGTVWFAPGLDGTPDNYGVIRLTLPMSARGKYQLDSAVHTHMDGPISGDCDFHVLHNGAEIFGKQIGPSSGTEFHQAILLSGGDTIDFAIGRGADGREYASR